MDALTRRALRQNFMFMPIFAALLFVPAWSLRFWQAWVYWLVSCASCLLLTLYFLKHDRALIARRLNAGPVAEKEKSQKIIQTFTAVTFTLLYIFPGLDHHFGWSQVPPLVSLAADAVVVIGFYIWFLTLRENTHASSIIEVGEAQRVISTGVYAYVRHPMYAGVALMLVVTPVALGSLWGLLLVVPAVAGIAWRLLDEERFLLRNLPGYPSYYRNTRFRLVPLIW